MVIGDVQQASAYLIDQMVRIVGTAVLREHAGEGLDKAYEVIGLLLWWTEAAGAVVGDHELVTMNATAIAVQTDIRGITKSVTAVQGVTGVKKDFLDVYPVEVVLIGKVTHTHCTLLFIAILSSEICGNLAPFTGHPCLHPIRIGVGLQPLLGSLYNLVKLCCLLITLQRRATSFFSDPCPCSIAVGIDRKSHSVLLHQCQTMYNGKELADIIGAIDWTETEHLLSRRDMYPPVFHPAWIATASSIHTEGFYKSSVNHTKRLTLHYLPMP